MNPAPLQFLVMGLGVMIAALSAWGAIAPERLLAWVTRQWGKRWSLMVAIGVRAVLGLALLAVADGSRCPLAFTVIGWLAIAGAAGVALAGIERIGRMLAWGAAHPPLLLRLWCLLGVALGVFLLWGMA